jgi:hypothetical protein
MKGLYKIEQFRTKTGTGSMPLSISVLSDSYNHVDFSPDIIMLVYQDFKPSEKFSFYTGKTATAIR